MKALKPVCLLAEAKELPPAVLWEYNFLNRENCNFNMLQQHLKGTTAIT